MSLPLHFIPSLPGIPYQSLHIDISNSLHCPCLNFWISLIIALYLSLSLSFSLALSLSLLLTLDVPMLLSQSLFLPLIIFSIFLSLTLCASNSPAPHPLSLSHSFSISLFDPSHPLYLYFSSLESTNRFVVVYCSLLSHTDHSNVKYILVSQYFIRYIRLDHQRKTIYCTNKHK